MERELRKKTVAKRRKAQRWDQYFLAMAALVATKSSDPSTQCGAVIVNEDNQVRSTGYNGFPRGVEYTAERMERPEKYFWFEHAERNALYSAETSLKGCKIYTNYLPCMDCARGIVQSGIAEIICPILNYSDVANREKWEPHHKRTLLLCKEAGVKVRFLRCDQP